MAAQDQSHRSDGAAGRLVAALLLALATAVLEFTGGFVSGSLALLSSRRPRRSTTSARRRRSALLRLLHVVIALVR
jgi:hypothetical protein